MADRWLENVVKILRANCFTNHAWIRPHRYSRRTALGEVVIEVLGGHSLRVTKVDGRVFHHKHTTCEFASQVIRCARQNAEYGD
jgi:hypothetical protein